MTEKTKRITLPVTEDIDSVRNMLTNNTGVKMTYNQTINYLIHFYLSRTQQPGAPRTQWRHQQ
tara:strand:- start:74 stop:262 length:189 start_codon:yes stop_codon:yes gene_type:complete